MQEMDVIIDACDGFHAKSKNEALKAELLPFDKFTERIM